MTPKVPHTSYKRFPLGCPYTSRIRVVIKQKGCREGAERSEASSNIEYLSCDMYPPSYLSSTSIVINYLLTSIQLQKSIMPLF